MPLLLLESLRDLLSSGLGRSARRIRASGDLRVAGLLLLAVLLVAPAAHAVPILSLSASATTVNVGDPIVLSVEISGLAPSEALAGYDLEITFDTAVLSYASASFQGFLGASSSNAFSIPAGASAFEVSFVDAATLLATQPGSGVLVNLVLDAVGVGNVSIGFNVPAANLVDQDAQPLAASFVPLASPIQVVPEPGTIALIGGGLLLTLAAARRRC